MRIPDSGSVIGKIRLIALGNVHALLNAVIDLNDPAIIEQHLRDLKSARDDLQNDTAAAHGNVVVLKQDIADLVTKIGRKSSDIDALLGDTTVDNHDAAVKVQGEILLLQDAQTAKQGELDTAVQVEESMNQALTALGHKVDELNSRLDTLKSMAASAAAKNSAANALTAAHQLAGSDVGSSVDSLEHRIRLNSATADERLKTALGQATGTEDSVLNARAKEALALRIKAKESTSAAA
jgi:phage shock protein A